MQDVHANDGGISLLGFGGPRDGEGGTSRAVARGTAGLAYFTRDFLVLSQFDRGTGFEDFGGPRDFPPVPRS